MTLWGLRSRAAMASIRQRSGSGDLPFLRCWKRQAACPDIMRPCEGRFARSLSVPDGQAGSADLDKFVIQRHITLVRKRHLLTRR